MDKQIAAVGKLGGSVALHRQLEVGSVHAAAVVGDADQPQAAAIDDHLDALGA